MVQHSHLLASFQKPSPLTLGGCFADLFPRLVFLILSHTHRKARRLLHDPRHHRRMLILLTRFMTDLRIHAVTLYRL